MRVQIVTPEREVGVADDATLVVARGIEGEVGIMPGHAPLMIALGIGRLRIVHADGARESIVVDGGFLQVNRDNVIVLAEYASPAEEVDAAALASEIEELRRALATEPENGEMKARLARAEALARLAG